MIKEDFSFSPHPQVGMAIEPPQDQCGNPRAEEAGASSQDGGDEGAHR